MRTYKSQIKKKTRKVGLVIVFLEAAITRSFSGKAGRLWVKPLKRINFRNTEIKLVENRRCYKDGGPLGLAQNWFRR